MAMDMSIASTLACLMAALFLYRLLVSPFRRALHDAPIIQKSWFDVFFRKSLSIKTLMADAYQKYLKNGKVIRIDDAIYVIPPSILEQSRKLPTSVLNSSMSNEETLYLAPSLGDDHWDVINMTRQSITRGIPAMIPILLEEIPAGFKTNLPPKNATLIERNGQTFYSAAFYPGVLQTVGMLATRLFFGIKYSRNPTFTSLAASYATSIQIQALVIGLLVPQALKPFVRRFILPYTPAAMRAKKIRKYIRDDVLAYLDADEEELNAINESGNGNFTILPLMVRYVQKQPDYKKADIEKLVKGVTGRTLGLLFAAVDTTSITFTQVIYDLIGHAKSDYADAILEEVNKVKAQHGGEWDLNSLGELKLLDSFIKESQRTHPIAVSLGGRKVVAEGGHTFEADPNTPGSTPLHFPKGSMISMPLEGVHTDPEIYPDPNIFQGFRFAQDEIPSSQPSDKFMSFGHGRHACPGRHLALNILKLMTIEFLTKYDWVEVERPKDVEFLASCLPDMQKEISIARKDGM